MPKECTFQLSIPYIEGSINTVFDAREPIDAAKSMWDTLSQHIVQNVPKMMFVMQNVSSKQYHTFDIKENSADGKFVINEINIELDAKNVDQFTKKVDDYIAARDKNQVGGKKKKKKYHSDDDDSSSSSTDYYPSIHRSSPVSFYHYTTSVYPFTSMYSPSILNPHVVAVQTPLFTPIFNPVLRTFVGLWP
jgi:hypothetical protein